MPVQAYPDLMDPWGMTIVPVTDLPFGEGLWLHGGERNPALAWELGFVASPLGHVLDPGVEDPGFQVSLGRVVAAIAGALPTARFALLDPAAHAMAAPPAGRDPTEAERRHRFRLRAALATAARVTPAPRKHRTAAPALRVAANALDMACGLAAGMPAAPFGVVTRTGNLAFAVPEDDGLRLGVVGWGMQPTDVPSLTLRPVPAARTFTLTGLGSTGAPCGEGLATDLLCGALQRMDAEVMERVAGVEVLHRYAYGTLHDEAFPDWEEASEAFFRQPASPQP